MRRASTRDMSKQDLLPWATTGHSGKAVLLVAPLSWAGSDRKSRAALDAYVKRGFERLAGQLEASADARLLLVVTTQDGEEQQPSERKWLKELNKTANAKAMTICKDPARLCSELAVPAAAESAAPKSFPAVLVLQGNPCTQLKQCVEGLRDDQIDAVIHAVNESSTKGTGAVGGGLAAGTIGGLGPGGSKAQASTAGNRIVGTAGSGGAVQQEVDAYCSETIRELMLSTKDEVGKLCDEVTALKSELATSNVVQWHGVCKKEHLSQIEGLCGNIAKFAKEEMAVGDKIRQQIDEHMDQAFHKLKDCESSEDSSADYVSDSIQQLVWENGDCGGLTGWLEYELAPLERLSLRGNGGVNSARREAPLVSRVKQRQSASLNLSGLEEALPKSPEEQSPAHPATPVLSQPYVLSPGNLYLMQSPSQLPSSGIDPHRLHSPPQISGTPGSGPGAGQGMGAQTGRRLSGVSQSGNGRGSGGLTTVVARSPGNDSASKRTDRRDKLWKTPLSKLLLSP